MRWRQHSAEFKAKVALEAIKGQRTMNEIAGEYMGYTRGRSPNGRSRCWRSCQGSSHQGGPMTSVLGPRVPYPIVVVQVSMALDDLGPAMAIETRPTRRACHHPRHDRLHFLPSSEQARTSTPGRDLRQPHTMEYSRHSRPASASPGPPGRPPAARSRLGRNRSVGRGSGFHPYPGKPPSSLAFSHRPFNSLNS